MMKPQITIIRCSRKTLSMKITPNGGVEVRVPLNTSDEAIRRFMDAHRRWLENHLAKIEQKQLNAAPRFTPEEISAMAQETSRFLPALIQEYSRKLNVRPARVTVRNQKTRWGSCSSQGGLNFNCLLAQAPEYVRRYVVIHELCHLREMNHSPAFWHLVASQMPDYPKAKEWLKTEGQKLVDRL